MKVKSNTADWRVVVNHAHHSANQQHDAPSHGGSGDVHGREVTTDDVVHAKAALDQARATGDPLRAELAEAGLNDLLDRLYLSQLSHVTMGEE